MCMRRTSVRLLILAVALTLTAWSGRAQDAPPKLVVLLVVDQFPSDYIDLYSRQWKHGLKRLLDTGAVFTKAAYPYGVTVTCPGHSSIGSGLVPAHHGMIANAWYDRGTSKAVACTEDPLAAPVTFGGAEGKEHHSPRRMTSQSFADQLRAQATQPPTIVSLSLKARSAIGMAGHAGPKTMVLWVEESGAFSTSTAYTSTPWPEIDEFVKANPPSRDLDKVWERLRPANTYRFDDDGVAETPPTGWTNVFPHPLATKPGVADSAYYVNWQRSPWSNDYLGEMAANLVGRLKLGQGEATDMLAVSFSALDMIGHPFGPRSHEVQDILARLDVTIGRLLDSLDQQVGRDRYVLGFSSDHGVMILPEQGPSLGFDAGRVSSNQIAAAVTKAILDSLKVEEGVRNLNYPNIYLSDAALAALKAMPAARKAITDAALFVPGVRRVYWADELRSIAPTRDATLQAMRKSFADDRNGDLMVVSKEYWQATTSGTTHGSPYAYDARVPVILMGAGIKPGKYGSAASPLDLAPTFARLTRVSLARTDGRVLTDALR
jgi:predicted AlkP superfamily pyrophosphatase or phosphodiesterase